MHESTINIVFFNLDKDEAFYDVLLLFQNTFKGERFDSPTFMKRAKYLHRTSNGRK